MTYTFTCLILSEHPFKHFKITIDATVTRISEIKPKLIDARSDILSLCPPACLDLWRVDILLSEEDGKFKILKSLYDNFRKIKVEKELGGKMPNGNKGISNYFGENPLPVEDGEDHPGFINFLVQCPNRYET